MRRPLPPVDVFDFREPLVLAGDPPVHYGWRVDWPAYHAACDARDAYNSALGNVRYPREEDDENNEEGA